MSSIGTPRGEAVQALEKVQETTHLCVDDLVAELDERYPPDLDATFCITAVSLPLALLPRFADSGAETIVGAEDPKDSLEVREDACEEEEPDFVEARQKAVVGEGASGCRWRKLVSERGEPGADQIGQVGDDQAGDERREVDRRKLVL